MQPRQFRRPPMGRENIFSPDQQEPGAVYDKTFGGVRCGDNCRHPGQMDLLARKTGHCVYRRRSPIRGFF